MAGTALPGRLNWQIAKVVETVEETPRVRSLVLACPDWPGHLAGQHVDVRLTAEDGYQAQRSYSLASAPEDHNLVLTVERLEDGEVSPYLTDVLHVGDQLELQISWQSVERPLVYICGPTAFVEAAATGLVRLGHDASLIRTERFGPTGT